MDDGSVCRVGYKFGNSSEPISMRLATVKHGMNQVARKFRMDAIRLPKLMHVEMCNLKRSNKVVGCFRRGRPPLNDSHLGGAEALLQLGLQGRLMSTHAEKGDRVQPKELVEGGGLFRYPQSFYTIPEYLSFLKSQPPHPQGKN